MATCVTGCTGEGGESIVAGSGPSAASSTCSSAYSSSDLSGLPVDVTRVLSDSSALSRVTSDCACVSYDRPATVTSSHFSTGGSVLATNCRRSQYVTNYDCTHVSSESWRREDDASVADHEETERNEVQDEVRDPLRPRALCAGPPNHRDADPCEEDPGRVRIDPDDESDGKLQRISGSAPRAGRTLRASQGSGPVRASFSARMTSSRSEKPRIFLRGSLATLGWAPSGGSWQSSIAESREPSEKPREATWKLSRAQL